MTGESLPAPTPAADAQRIEDAAARLYALLPTYLRLRDGAEAGYALRALIGVLASGAAEVDAGLDALYDAGFVETAPEAALADLADLVGAVALAPMPPGAESSLRGYVANTIRYRRGKGTARVLEALCRDVAGLGAVAVEYYQRLAQAQDLTDIRADRPGTARLTPGETAALARGAFDRLPHLADLRSIARAGGRHHVPHVGLHITRLAALDYPAPAGTALPPEALAGVPVMRDWSPGGVARAGHFQLAAQPEARLPLFNPDRRGETDAERATPADLAGRLRRLPLALECRERRAALIEGRPPRPGAPPWFSGSGAPFTLFVRRQGETTFTRLAPEDICIANLEAPPTARPGAADHVWYSPGKPPVRNVRSFTPVLAFDPVTARAVTAAPVPPATEIEEIRLAHATGAGRAIGASAADRNLPELPFDIVNDAGGDWFVRLVDAARPADPPGGAVRRVPTLAAALADWSGAGPGQRGLVVLLRADRETAAAGLTLHLRRGQDLTLVAADWRAPRILPGQAGNIRRLGYIVRKARRYTLDAGLTVTTDAAPDSLGPGRLMLDGLELTRGLSLAAGADAAISLRHTTLRSPGGAALGVLGPLAGAALAFDRSITGAIVTDHASGPGLASLSLTGSVIAADGAAAALAATGSDTVICDCTVLGPARLKTLEGTNVIFDGPLTVIRRQSGCLRYSYAPPGAETPRRFRCQPELAEEASGTAPGSEARAALRAALRPAFLDRDLGAPALALLHPRMGREITAGGEDEAEMGVFAALASGTVRGNLSALFDEFLPFGLEAGVIDDTLSEALFATRSRP